MDRMAMPSGFLADVTMAHMGQDAQGGSRGREWSPAETISSTRYCSSFPSQPATTSSCQLVV